MDTGGGSGQVPAAEEGSGDGQNVGEARLSGETETGGEMNG